MSWFMVDDQIAFQAATVAAGNAAMGLWVRAGAWSMAPANLTDGYIPDGMVAALGSAAQRAKLVKVGLWTEVGDGVQFVEWTQTSAKKISEQRQKSAARQRKSREAFSKNAQVRGTRHGVTHASVTPSVTPEVTGAQVLIPSSGPVGGEVTEVDASDSDKSPPLRTCSNHPQGTDGPCGFCKEARLAADAWVESQAAKTEKGPADRYRPLSSSGAFCDDCRNENGYVVDPETKTPIGKCLHGAPTLRLVNG